MKNIVEVLVAIVIATAAVGMFVTTCSVSRQSDAPATVVVYDTVWRDTIIVVQRPPIRFRQAARVECSDSVISDTTTTDSAGHTSRVVVLERVQIASVDTSIFGKRFQSVYNSRTHDFDFSAAFPPDTFKLTSAQVTKTIEKMMPRPWYEAPAYVAGGAAVGAILVLVVRGLK